MRMAQEAPTLLDVRLANPASGKRRVEEALLLSLRISSLLLATSGLSISDSDGITI